MLVRVLYVSSISPGVSPSDIQRLISSAQRRNRQLDLTGALLICDGHFVQVLEGRELAIEEMMRKIALDERHHRLLVKERLRIARRMFASWDMAFIDYARCGDELQNLLQGRSAPQQFMDAMTAWIDEEKSGPLTPNGGGAR